MALKILTTEKLNATSWLIKEVTFAWLRTWMPFTPEISVYSSKHQENWNPYKSISFPTSSLPFAASALSWRAMALTAICVASMMYNFACPLIKGVSCTLRISILLPSQNYELSAYEILLFIRLNRRFQHRPCLLAGQITSHLRWQLVLELGDTPGAVDDANSIGLHIAGHVLSIGGFPFVSMDWFCWENLNRKPMVFTIKIMGVSGVNFPNKTNPLIVETRHRKWYELSRAGIHRSWTLSWISWGAQMCSVSKREHQMTQIIHS